MLQQRVKFFSTFIKTSKLDYFKYLRFCNICSAQLLMYNLFNKNQSGTLPNRYFFPQLLRCETLFFWGGGGYDGLL